jgi:ribonuclease P/MRP protein subunit RPP40
MDIAILDFSKAFDKVPHQKLLHKLEHYGIRGPLLRWFESFLCQRTMKVVVEGTHSKEVPVLSGVPQGTVLGPLLFLCHINDLPCTVNSEIRLFADDCLLYRQIRNIKDHIKLQQDLQSLEKWSSTWGMEFNTKKCYILSIKSKTSYFYTLGGHILQSVTSQPYLGINISEDLKWNTHINKICSRASSTIGFLRRNLRRSPKMCRLNAYTALVRSTLEYGAVVWDPYLKSDIEMLEKVQRKAARFIFGDYRNREAGCVTKMLQDLDLPTLQQRRKELRLTFLFKVIEGLSPGIPACDYFTPVRGKRHIQASKQFKDYKTTNFVEKHQNNNSKCYKTNSQAVSDTKKHSFFDRTILEWNQLDEMQVNATSVTVFKTLLKRD